VELPVPAGQSIGVYSLRDWSQRFPLMET
jgi:hypothetical protein